ncbi:FAD-dependent oxidoreductase [Streptomyces cinnamoneus]|uniref:hydroxysqualene dehydroxylase n=1 Tax=Streptomyces cinnamoneus TaxID=53446 RepID=UPI0033E5AD2B
MAEAAGTNGAGPGGVGLQGNAGSYRPARRAVLRCGAAAGAGAMGSALVPAVVQRAVAGSRTGGRTVAVLGGGVGGLTAAHELAERGFEVSVYEQRRLGGKARSVSVPGTGSGGRQDLPGELGHRAVFGFYHHLFDTLRRIPLPAGAGSALDNLVEVPEWRLSRAGGHEDVTLPFSLEARPLDVDLLQRLLLGAADQFLRLPPGERLALARRLTVLLTSSHERSLGQWEHTPWTDFLSVRGNSREFSTVWGRAPALLDALKPELASTRTCGQAMESVLLSLMRRGTGAPPVQIFDAPTSQAWFDPWERHLRTLGVRFAMAHTVDALELRGGVVTAARARTPTGTARIEADWFVVALPTERARLLWNEPVRRADPRLAAMDLLQTNWCQGVQFFLRRPTPLARGHILHPDAPWALASVSQAQFWREDFARTWGDGQVHDRLSVDINDWDEPGPLHGKPARRCTRKEIAQEVWAQLKASLEDTGREALPDGILHSWYLSPAVAGDDDAVGRGDAELVNTEPYLRNDAGSWAHRPDATTAIGNMFLAAEYVRTYSNVDFACMETACEAARRAANAVLEAARSGAEPARLFPGYRPPELEAAKRLDTARYRLGLPHLLDARPPARQAV